MADLKGCLTVEVVTASGRSAGVEFRKHLDCIEIWHHGERSGVLGCRELGTWLAGSPVPLRGGTVELSHDRVVDVRGRVAVTLPDVRAWTLSPSEESALIFLARA